jgi:hypothetical protein
MAGVVKPWDGNTLFVRVRLVHQPSISGGCLTGAYVTQARGWLTWQMDCAC